MSGWVRIMEERKLLSRFNRLFDLFILLEIVFFSSRLSSSFKVCRAQTESIVKQNYLVISWIFHII